MAAPTGAAALQQQRLTGGAATGTETADWTQLVERSRAMNGRFQACLVVLVMAALPGVVSAQSGASVPLQRGVSVQLVVTSNAVAVPNADEPDALVVALTADGRTYLRANPVRTPDLADSVRSILSTRKDKTLYIKADARVPYARVVEVIDAVQKSGVEGVTFLTTQQDAGDQGRRPVPPKGLELRVH
jgi:biopolymer transport protein ExbD